MGVRAQISDTWSMRTQGWPRLLPMRLPKPPGRRWKFMVSALALLVLGAGPSFAEDGGLWPAGPYMLSDELGDFTISAVGGTGTADDPIVVFEEFRSATPATLTIRTAMRRMPRLPGEGQLMVLHVRLDILNNSGHPWIEFEFELQEAPGRPSVFGDGLSFDQRNQSPETIVSSAFSRFDRKFEPYDRLLFSGGQVDPLRTVSFQFVITDFTPRWTFYLVQDPRIASS